MLVDPYPVQVGPDAELFGFPLLCPLDDLNYKRHLTVGVHTYNDSGESCRQGILWSYIYSYLFSRWKYIMTFILWLKTKRLTLFTDFKLELGVVDFVPEASGLLSLPLTIQTRAVLWKQWRKYNDVMTNGIIFLNQKKKKKTFLHLSYVA